MDYSRLNEFGFELFVKMLKEHPIDKWYEERRNPIMNFLNGYSEQFPSRVKWIRRDIGPSRVFTSIRFVVGKGVFIYLEEADLSSKTPIINWFQLETVINGTSGVSYTTRLVLDSDDCATPQGGPWLVEIDNEKGNEIE